MLLSAVDGMFVVGGIVVPLSTGGCDVVLSDAVAQGGAEPSGHAVGQLPLASGVSPLSQLVCPGPVPVLLGADGAG